MIRCPGAGAALVLLALAGSCRHPGVTAGRLDSMMLRGRTQFAAEAFDSALATFDAAVAEARRTGNDTALAAALTESGLTGRLVGRMEQSQRDQEEALRLKERLGLRAALSRSLNALGLLAHDDNRNRDAIRYWEEAAAAGRAAHNPADEAKALGNQSLALRNLGEFESARRAARGLRQAARSLDSARLEGIALDNEARVDLDLGAAHDAVARLDTALALYRRADFRTGEQHALGQSAYAWELIGDYTRVFAVLDSALNLARRHGLRFDEAVNLRLLADAHARLGDFRRAVRLYEKADSLFRTTGLDGERAITLRGAGAAYAALGNARRATESVRAALRLDVAAAETPAQVENLVLLADFASTRGEADAAARWLDSARAVLAGGDRSGSRMAVSLAAARMAIRAGRPRDALRALADIPPSQRTGDLGADWEASALGARAWSALGRQDSAIELGRRAVAALERVRGSLASDDLRGTLSAERADVYGDLVLALLRTGRVDEAFTVADGARSRGLLERLGSARTVRPGEVPSQLIEAEQLLQRIDQLTQRLRERELRSPRERAAAADAEDGNLTAALTAARGEYEALIIRTGEAHPRATALLGATSATPRRVRPLLGPGQVLIEYLLTPSALVSFVLTRDTVAAISHPLDPGALTEQVRTLGDLWRTPRRDWKVGLPVARALHAELIGPLGATGLLAGARELLVVPHGILGQVPFAALQDPRTGRFLVEGHAISRLPSAAALAGLGATRNADPLPGRADVVALAPFPEDLPATLLEVRSIAGGRRAARTVVGAGASEPALRAALTEGAVVHVATHGVLNARNPMFSRIEVARPARAAFEDDGRLEVHEILGIRIRSPLVFFSGCETGGSRQWSGDPMLGSGEMTLAQAVLAAGADQVVATLWRIDDARAAELAGRFYAALRTEDPSAALARAQRDMLRSRPEESPFYWAGYTVSGVPGAAAQTPGVPSVLPTVTRTNPSGSPRSPR